MAWIPWWAGFCIMFSATKAGVLSTKTHFVVTEGYAIIPTFNWEYWGYDAVISGGIGSIEPALLKGATIDRCVYFEIGDMIFRFALKGNRPQTFFYSIQPQGEDVLLTSGCTYEYNSGVGTTFYDWTTSKPSDWTGSSTPTVKIIV
jgi:hypothetical protein